MHLVCLCLGETSAGISQARVAKIINIVSPVITLITIIILISVAVSG